MTGILKNLIEYREPLAVQAWEKVALRYKQPRMGIAQAIDSVGHIVRTAQGATVPLRRLIAYFANMPIGSGIRHCERETQTCVWAPRAM